MALAKERIIDVLQQIVPDKDAEDIVFYLQDKENISEFIIAEELDLEIHRTRNILYRLLDANVVSFKRKKDKIKGWYICYWDFNEPAISHLEEKLRLETIAKLKDRLSNEQGGFFYMCRHAHIRQNFEDAFESDFKCPECGELMNQQDNERTISFLTERITKLEAEQEAFAQERAIFLKEASKKAEQELKEAQDAAEKKMEKYSSARAIKHTTKSAEEKLALTKAARAAARKTTAKKKTTKKKTTKKTTKKATDKATTSKKRTTAKTKATPQQAKKTSGTQATTKKKSTKATVKKKETAKKTAKKPSKKRTKKTANKKTKQTTSRKKTPVKKKSGMVRTIARKIGNKK